METDTVTFTPTDGKPIFLTEQAVEAIKSAVAKEGKPGDGLRVSVAGGGCAGYQYSLDFETTLRDDDVKMDFDGIAVYLDSISATYLTGTVIDYVSGLQGTGFKFNNPNPARRTCGCGSSM